jgi:hypothetical protein
LDHNIKILILGDSFAADWSAKYLQAQGWPNLLANRFEVTNLAQAGVGEYKILKQTRSVPNLGVFDLAIISHTSPYRVHTRQHPVHHDDILHKNSDLCISDIAYHSDLIKETFNFPLKSANRFFLDHFDQEYQETIYQLIKQQIHQYLKNIRTIVIHNSISLLDYPDSVEILDITSIEKSNPGLHNHLDDKGNFQVFNCLCKKYLE